MPWHYQSTSALPQHNITCWTAKYPAVVAEKGTGALKALLADVTVDATKPAITAMKAAPPRPTPLRRRLPLPSPPHRCSCAGSDFRQQPSKDKDDFCVQARGPGQVLHRCAARRGPGHGQGQRCIRSRPRAPRKGESVPRLALFPQQSLMPEGAALLSANQCSARPLRYINWRVWPGLSGPAVGHRLCR